MNELIHEFILGIAFGVGVSLPMMTWMFLDRFMANLNWKFWEWKRKNFK